MIFYELDYIWDVHVQNIKIPTIVVSSIHLSIHIFIFSTWVSFDSEDINYWNRQQPLASSSLRTPHCRRGDLLLLREVFLSGGGRLHDHSHISCNMTDTLTHKHISDHIMIKQSLHMTGPIDIETFSHVNTLTHWHNGQDAIK